MMKQFNKEFKAKVALTAIKGEKTISEISSEFGVHSTQIGNWKKIVQKGVPELFTNKKVQHGDNQEKLVDELYKTIGQLKIENDWFKKN